MIHERGEPLSEGPGGAAQPRFLGAGAGSRSASDREGPWFQDCINRTDLGSRKAHYLVKISKKLGALRVPLDQNRLRRIGWTKLEIIADHLTDENATELLEMAELGTTRELTVAMRGEEPASKEHTILLRFTPRQYKAFEKAILQNGGSRKPKGRGLLNEEKAMMRIITKARSPA